MELTSGSEKKMSILIESQVKRRDPTISQLTAKYNQECKALIDMVNNGQAPRTATQSEVPRFRASGQRKSRGVQRTPDTLSVGVCRRVILGVCFRNNNRR